MGSDCVVDKEFRNTGVVENPGKACPSDTDFVTDGTLFVRSTFPAGVFYNPSFLYAH